MKVEVDEKKLAKEFSELFSLVIRECGSFSSKFPELYYKVFIPTKVESDRK